MTIKQLVQEIKNWRLTKKRAINLFIGIIAILIYEFLGRPIYRPYIYNNKINDFHIADTLGNSLGTVATIFVLIGFLGSSKDQHLFIIKAITIGVVVYELAHPLLGKTIDPFDVIATIISGAICLFMYNKISKHYT